ncbi:hypothetical protein Tco_0078099 [Tanacetum coccineum]
MDTTRAQQQALDDELFAPADRLKIWKSNLQLSSILKSKEPTLHVALDALKLTPSIMHLRSLLMYQKYTCRVLGPLSSDIFLYFIFEEPPLEEEILSFIRDLGHTEEIKFISDVNVNHTHQPWRSFAAIINKCLSGKTTALENLVYQVENKNSKKNNDMYYPRFTKVIVDYFMAKDQRIPRRNKMFWHYARDEFIFTTIRVISKHQDTQVYDSKTKNYKKKADSESSPKTKSTQASKGKRITTLAKGDKSAKKKQSATKSKGLTVLSEVALTEAQQMKIAIERSKIQTHSSHASGSGDGVDIQSKVPDEQQQNISGQ